MHIVLLDHFLKSEKCFLLIGIQATLLRADNSLSSRKVDGSDAGFDLVDVLAALAATPEGIIDHLLGVKLFHRSNRAEAEVNEPTLPFVLGPVRTAADPLN